uniref:UVR domain-containing protein n=1 Tax=Hyaloperonospora arabidopsidis (strain Emoy2) TaxID=559515 RepID=M4BZA7_HYAAE
MFGRFFKNKEDGKSGPPGHQRQGGQNSADEPPVGGGFFNLPPPVLKPEGSQGVAGSAVPSNYVGGGNAGTAGGYPSSSGYGNNSPRKNQMMGGGAPLGTMDMFGGMSVKAPTAAVAVAAPAVGVGLSGNKGGGRYNPQPPSQPQYGNFGGTMHYSGATQSLNAGGSLFSGLEVAPGAPAPVMRDDGSARAIATNGHEQRKYNGSTGPLTHQHVAGSKSSGVLDSLQYSRTSASGSTSTTTSRSSSKAVKKKTKKTFRPGFGRQLSDESAAALQRGDLKEDDIIHQREGRLTPDRSDSSHSSRSAAAAPTDLAHLLPPVKSGSVLRGLTVHKGNTTSGGGVLAGLTVHTSALSLPSPTKVLKSPALGSGETGMPLSSSIHEPPRSIAGDDADEAANDDPVRLPDPVVYPKSSSPVLAATLTPEKRLFGTLRDFHESALSFRQFTLKQHEEENRLLERKAQLANQLTQYEADLRDVEVQQQHACEVEDFEKADALNATINSVRHCITLTESDVRKLDSELVAFVRTKEKAFANQLRSTRGTLRELEKFCEDQESERTVVRNEYKLYEINQKEQLQFEAERIGTELHHVSVSLENVNSEKSEIEATIEGQCSSEFAVQARLIEEKSAVEEEVRELELQLKKKLERVRKIQSAIDTAQRDINTVRKRYSRQLKRIADRENGIKKTKAEVESDGDHLEQQRQEFHDKLKQYADNISLIGNRIGTVKKEMRAASLLANVLELQETRREQSLIRKKQQTAELSSLNDATAVAEQSFTMLNNQHVELEKSLSIHRNAIASAETMIPRLEQEKKVAAAQRNFKEAARISKDIKALEKDRSTAEEMVEVVEMELQDLKERIDRREVEYEEKKKELREMEKHLELATLQELWKEAKSLQTALRKIEKCKSHGDAANDGIDFRSSAMLLVQAEYDACVLQVGVLEKKYDVSDPTKDDEVEDDNDDDDSLDGEEKKGSERSSFAGKVTDVEKMDAGDKNTENSTSVLKEIAAKLLQLESRIQEATTNEEYDLAANLDDQIESLKQRQQSIEASVEEEVFSDDDYENESSMSAAGESSSREGSTEASDEAQVECTHGEMMSPVNAAHTRDEVTHSSAAVHERVVEIEEQTELATENEDYDTAASYSDEMRALREHESIIRDQLGSPYESGVVTAFPTTEGLAADTDNPCVIETAASSVLVKSPREMDVGSVTCEPVDGGPQLRGDSSYSSKSSSDVQMTEVEVVESDQDGRFEPEEAAAHVNFEVISPTSSEMKDSFFGNPGVHINSASLVAPSASGLLFGGLQMSGNFQVSTSSFVSPQKVTEGDNENEEDASDETTARVADFGAYAPVDGGSMFSGLQLSSSAVNVGASVQTESTKEESIDMFGGLKLSHGSVSTTTAAVQHASTGATSNMFGGLKLSGTSASAVSVEHTTTNASTNLFSGSESSDDEAGTSIEVLNVHPDASKPSNSAASADEVDVASSAGRSLTESSGGTRMSIHELSEHTGIVSVQKANQNGVSLSDAPTDTSATMPSGTCSVETTATTVVLTTPVTEVSDDDKINRETEQDST